ncbi:MAG: T9SS type A sorting domain-containing protein [Bacteroidia bacterium]|nr:T9SS type A sorting domain-containing protein [Bacteroidia bacterium]
MNLNNILSGQYLGGNADGYAGKKSSSNIPLPIQLISFEIENYLNKAVIKWIVASEINNERFIIEKSFDAVAWEKVSEIKGAGNSNILTEYSLIDYNPNDSDPDITLIFYRLKQKDFNGNFQCFEPKSFYLTHPNCDNVEISYNTLSQRVTVSVTSNHKTNASIYFTNILGEMLITKEIVLNEGGNTFSFNVTYIYSGIYIIKIIMDSSKQQFSKKIGLSSNIHSIFFKCHI